MPAGAARGSPRTLSTTPRSQPALAGQPKWANKWAVLATVGIGTFMTTLDSSIVNISLPAIARSFGTPLNGSIEWVVIVYLVVIAALLLTFGRLSDAIGRKPIWLAGLGTFTSGSALCGFAPSLGLLVAARALQGVGGALLFAPSVALITDAFPKDERGRAIGLNAVVVSLGISVGPTLGGFITEHASWRWIFFLNVPVGVLGAVAALRVLQGKRRGRERFDVPGAVLVAVGLSTLTLGLSFGQEWGWTSMQMLACLGITAVSLVALVVVERRVEAPNVDLGLLTCRPFAAALLSLVLSFLALFGVGFLMPFYAENLRGFSPSESGLLLTPLSVAIAVVAPLSGTVADRAGARWIASGGLALTCAGLVALSQLDARSGVFDIVWRLALVGVGSGLFQSPNNRAIMTSAPGGEQGQASGLLGTGRVVGQSLSVALAGAVFAIGGGTAANALLASLAGGQGLAPDQLAAAQQTFTTAFRHALLVSAGIVGVGVLTSLERGGRGAAQGLPKGTQEPN